MAEFLGSYSTRKVFASQSMKQEPFGIIFPKTRKTQWSLSLKLNMKTIDKRTIISNIGLAANITCESTIKKFFNLKNDHVIQLIFQDKQEG